MTSTTEPQTLKLRVTEAPPRDLGRGLARPDRHERAGEPRQARSIYEQLL